MAELPGTVLGVAVSDRIVLTIPTDPRFRSVATLVVGGIGSRADLAYERMDDLQLAVMSVLDAVHGDTATIEADTDGATLRLALGGLRDGTASDAGLARVLAPLVDEVGHESRDGTEWVTLGVKSSAG
jgi:hypothetical protein